MSHFLLKYPVFTGFFCVILFQSVHFLCQFCVSFLAKKVSFGPLSATLTPLKSGTLAGKWRITYRDRDGVRRIGGTLSTEKAAKTRALEILRDLDASNNLGQLTRDEEALIFAIREAGVPPQALLPTLKDLKELESILLADAVETFISRNVEDADYSYEQRKDYLRVLNELRRHFGPIELSAVTPAEIEKWTDRWEVSAKRHNNKRSLSGQLLELGRFEGICSEEPCGEHYPKTSS